MAVCSNCGAPLEADAVFCTNCGTKVEASQPTTQEQPAPQPTPQQEAAPQQAPVYQAQPQAAAGTPGFDSEAIKGYAQKLANVFVNAFKKPADTLENLSNEKFSFVAGPIVVEAVLFAIILFTLGVRINSAVKQYSYGFVTTNVVNSVSLFFWGILLIVAAFAAEALAVMLVTKCFAKVEMSYTQAVGVVAAKAIAYAPVTAIAWILSFGISIESIITSGSSALTIIYIILAVVAVGSVISLVFALTALKKFLTQDNNKKVWQLVLTYIAATVFVAIASYIIGKLFGSSLSGIVDYL